MAKTASNDPNGDQQIFEEIMLHKPPPLRLRHRKLPIEQVYFDSENPRLKYKKELFPDTPDEELLFKAEDTKLLLKDVKANGILDPIYVVPDGNGGWTVKEGNRRTCVMKQLHRDNPSDPRYSFIPARVMPDETSPEQSSLLMLSFHVSGKLKWEPHEKAGEIWNALNRLHVPVSELITICHMSASSLKKAVDTYDLLEHFKRIDDGRYAKGAEGKWSYFAEMFKVKDFRQRFDKGQEWRDQFCTWVGEGRIPKAEDVRLLEKILTKSSKARTLFEDEAPDVAFKKAMKEFERSTRPGSKFYKDLDNMAQSGRFATIADQDAAKDNEAARDTVLEAYSVLVKFMNSTGITIPAPARR